MVATVLFGFVAAGCAGSTSDASTAAEDTTSEAPAVVEEVEETPETQAPEEAAEPEPAADEEPTEEEPVEEEPAEPDEAAAPVEETAVEVSPTFEGSFVDLNGETIDLASYQGQDVVLWFWAPW